MPHNTTPKDASDSSPCGDQFELRGLFLLPYDIQSYIFSFLRQPILLRLALANHHFNDLATQWIYHNVEFNGGEEDYGQLTRINRSRRQQTFINTLKARPELGLHCRRLAWPWQNGSWALLTYLPGLRVIDFLSHANDSRVPQGLRTSLFPELRHARLTGRFPLGALEAILWSSPQLRELNLSDSLSISSAAGVEDIGGFLRSCVSNKQLESLTDLILDKVTGPYRGEDLMDTFLPFVEFLNYCGPHLRLLMVRADGNREGESFCCHIVPLIANNKWKNLKVFGIMGFKISSKLVKLIRDNLPTLEKFICNDKLHKIARRGG